ncbi:MAG: DMT family transporter [Hyphomicrobiaceae bacterium]
MSRPDRSVVAVLTILSAAAITSVQDVLIKWISGDYPFHQMQAIRCLAAMPIVVFALLWNEPIQRLWAEGWRQSLGRGLIYAIASVCFYLTATAMPFAEAVAIYFTMPLLVAALAGRVLGEWVPVHRWVAVVLGFAGILVMLRPGFRVFEPAALVGLLCALLYAVGHLLTRRMGLQVSTSVLAVHQNVMYLASAILISLVFGWGGFEMTSHPSLAYVSRPWVWPSLEDALFIMFLGASTGLLMVLFTLAYRLADSSFVAPFEYSAMFWAVVTSYVILGEFADLMSFIGMAMIVGAGLFMLVMDRYMGARRPSEPAIRGSETARQLDLPGPVARPVWPRQIARAVSLARPQGRR